MSPVRVHRDSRWRRDSVSAEFQGAFPDFLHLLADGGGIRVIQAWLQGERDLRDNPGSSRRLSQRENSVLAGLPMGQGSGDLQLTILQPSPLSGDSHKSVGVQDFQQFHCSRLGVSNANQQNQPGFANLLPVDRGRIRSEQREDRQKDQP